jgi:PAS domain S-box-containing protein
MSDSSLGFDGQQLAEASMDGVGVVEDRSLVYANDAFANLLGFEEGRQLVGIAWEDVIEPDDRSLQASDLLSRVHETGDWRGQAFAKSQEGSRVPVQMSLQTADEGMICVVRDDMEQSECGQELDRYETILETVDDGVYVLDENLEVETGNERFFEMLEAFGFSREEAQQMHAHDLVVKEDERAYLEAEIARAIDRESSTGSFEMSAETPAGEPIVLESRFRLYPAIDEHRGCIGIIRDVTERKERERRLKRQRDELDTLNRINELLLAVARDLFESPMDEDIEQHVCTRLAESDLYQLAWIGKPEVRGDRLVTDTMAGLDKEYVESLRVPTQEDATVMGPSGRAFRTGRIQVSQDIQQDSSVEPWRDEALERNIRSVAAVPLAHDETTYGILTVYAGRSLAFTEREQRGFEILGEAIGYAINARRTRQLLFAERVVNLEFRFTDSSEVVLPGTDRLTGPLELEGYLATRDGSWLTYLTVAERDADQFVSGAREDPDVESIQPIGNGPEQIIAMTLSSALLDEVAALGGRVISYSIDEGHGTVEIEVPQSTDTGEFVDQIQSHYPETELIAKRDGERPIERSMWLSGDGSLDLTQRQQQALEAAYLSGYFEWPRESNAEDVAEMVGVSRPTLQAHLRKAEKQLLSALFDGSESVNGTPAG